MKKKELHQKLSRLQTRAYNLQSAIQELVSELAREMEIQKKLEEKEK